MNDDYGGGSLTALPVIETQVEEYIFKRFHLICSLGRGEEGRGGEGSKEEVIYVNVFHSHFLLCVLVCRLVMCLPTFQPM